MSRLRSASKIILWNILLQVILILSGFILPRMIIMSYGSEVNGLVTTIRQIASYFSILGLGIGSACQVSFYKPLKENNKEEINGVFNATKLYFTKIAYVYIPLSILICYLVVANSKIQSLSTINVFFILTFSLVGSGVDFIITNKYKLLITADQKLYVLAKVQSLGIIIYTFFAIVIILNNGNVLFIQLGYMLTFFMRYYLTKRYVRKHYIYLNKDDKPMYDLIKHKKSAFIYQLSPMIINMSPAIIVAGFMGYINASVYAIYNMIYSSITMLVNTMTSGLAPSFANLLLTGESVMIKENFSVYIFVQRVLLFSLYTCALILIIPFISLYIVSEDYYLYQVESLAILFTISGISRLIRVPFVTLVEANGAFKENSRMNILEAILVVLFSVLLVNRYGTLGILASVAVFGIIRTIMYMVYVQKNIVVYNLIKKILIYIVNTILLLLLYYLLGIEQVVSYFDWIFHAIESFFIVLTCFLGINFILEPREFNIVIKKILSHRSV